MHFTIYYIRHAPYSTSTQQKETRTVNDTYYTAICTILTAECIIDVYGNIIEKDKVMVWLQDIRIKN